MNTSLNVTDNNSSADQSLSTKYKFSDRAFYVLSFSVASVCMIIFMYANFGTSLKSSHTAYPSVMVASFPLWLEHGDKEAPHNFAQANQNLERYHHAVELSVQNGFIVIDPSPLQGFPDSSVIDEEFYRYLLSITH